MQPEDENFGQISGQQCKGQTRHRPLLPAAQRRRSHHRETQQSNQDSLSRLTNWRVQFF